MELGERRYLFHVLRNGVSPCKKGKAARWEVTVSSHKFKIGQFVNYLGRQSASGVYQVTQLLPPEGEVFQYRIQNVNEPHERVAKEHELRRA